MKNNNPNNITKEEFIGLLNSKGELQQKLMSRARLATQRWFDNTITVRGVIEMSNHCDNDCGYCSMAKSNDKLSRYVISSKDIIDIIEEWIRQGIHIFHLVSGETKKISNDELSRIVSFISEKGGQSILVTGHKTKQELKQLYEAGARYYISKFEISNNEKYKLLNNKSGSLEGKKRLLYDLKDIGFNVGTGNIIGLPYQEDEDIYNDLMLIKEIKPFFASTSVFIPNRNTRYQDYRKGDIQKTLNFIALMRLLLKYPVYIPTNSSLEGHKNDAFFCGANLTSVNLTPEECKKNYMIYDLKRNDTLAYFKLQDFCKKNNFKFKSVIGENNEYNYDESNDNRWQNNGGEREK